MMSIKKMLSGFFLYLFLIICGIPYGTCTIILNNQISIEGDILIAGETGRSPECMEDPGTLSGYVTDTAMNPIEGALLRVYFHETYREDYSDATGYYHVTDIPLCYCLKNATCTKEEYHPTWVSLAITENTTYDFVLIGKGTTLYVGGSGPGNYSRIQDAINDSSDGDIVFVYDDSSPYHENLIVDKAVILQGENKATTIIDGGSVTILILADNVMVSGFTIMNSEWLYDIHRAGISILSNHTVIDDTIITHVWQGIECGWFNRSVKNIYLYHNTIDFVKGQGISIRYTTNATVLNNSINNTLGIAIDLWNVSAVYLIYNSLRNISDGHGIALWNAHDCLMFKNTIKQGAMQGISLTEATKIDIIANVITSMKEIGISSEGTVTIAGNAIDACVEYGILASGDRCTIVQNNVSNTSTAIFLSEGRQCSILSNLITHNENGLILVGVSDSRVRDNNFMDNKNDANFSALFFRHVSLFTCRGTRFDANYWGSGRFLPKIIPGFLYLTKDGQDFTRIPLFKLDLQPRHEPTIPGN